MPLPEDSLRVAIVGATSLRGQDLKSWIDESGFPAGEVRLFDEEVVAGTLTEAGGEATVVQAIDEDSFRNLRFAFFAGSRSFAKAHGLAAAHAGATVIDLTGELATTPGARVWIPRLDPYLSPPPLPGNSPTRGESYIAPSAPAIIACTLAAAFGEWKPARVAITFFQPVSERGKEGIEELESQTVKLLSLQPMPQQVFDSQVAFNMLDRWGPESSETLLGVREMIAQQVRQYLGGRITIPAMTLVQAPVFYGYAFSAMVEFAAAVDVGAMKARLEAAGFETVDQEGPGPSNTGIAGESKALISAALKDSGIENAYWFWGVADNVRLPVANALQIAERILAS
jgi:aspartate-semialdehyde dehydrogenase